jgi:hypothetical protein
MTKKIQNSITLTCKCKYNEVTLLHLYLLKAFKDTKITIEACGLGDWQNKQNKQTSFLNNMILY